MTLPNLLTASGTHEAEVRRRFPDSFTYAGADPEFEGPLVLLGFFNRSGSNLLGRYLKGTSGFSGFNEHLNHPVICKTSDRLDLAEFPDYFRAAQSKHARKRGHIHGFKAAWDQVLMLKRARIDAMYAGVRLIHIVREDLVGQAISLSIAQQTQQWTSDQAGKSAVEPVYDAHKIARALQACAEAETRMRLLAQVLDLPYLRVTYETLDSDPAVTMRAVGDFLGRDLSDWTPEPVPIQRQATDRNAEWRARYLAEADAALTGGIDPDDPTLVQRVQRLQAGRS